MYLLNVLDKKKIKFKVLYFLVLLLGLFKININLKAQFS